MRDRAPKHSIIIIAIVLIANASLSANDFLPDDFDPIPRPYLQYKVTLGLTLESPFPIGNENRTRYNLGGGAGLNFEMHLLYPVSLGFNYRHSRIDLRDPDIDALLLRTFGLTMRMFLDPRKDRQPYLLLSAGAGSARQSAQPPHNQGSSQFLTAEFGAGYMMRMSGHSWLRFELAYTGNTQIGNADFGFGYPVYSPAFRTINYELSGIMFRIEAGIVSW